MNAHKKTQRDGLGLVKHKRATTALHCNTASPALPTDSEIKALPASKDFDLRLCDQVRVAYAWLDAQKKTKNPRALYIPLKHIIEQWAKRYVAATSVQVAADLHPDVTGVYPNFSISSRLTYPNIARIGSLSGRDPNYTSRYMSEYKVVEGALC